eukprot:TRINITY_DN103736_c0_g1_i1.p1 TRINITY_DN103736_c0_g1~~TRINITY_DN103736_c0_g1_i1.p1  ORF type:complete len:337 (-),score=54.67 TRINITY_DN103736_c0_g1_i1:49-1014(-)
MWPTRFSIRSMSFAEGEWLARRVLGSPTGFILISAICLAETIASSFVLLPLRSFQQDETQLLLPAGFFSLSRLCVLLLLMVTLRESRRPGGEEALSRFPRLVAMLAPGVTGLLALFYAGLVVARPWAEERVRSVRIFCACLAGANAALLAPLTGSVSYLTRRKDKCGAIKVFVFGRERQLELGDKCCTICLMDFVRGDRLAQLPCGHVYHSACINEWLEVRPRCPMRCPQLVLPLQKERKIVEAAQEEGAAGQVAVVAERRAGAAAPRTASGGRAGAGQARAAETVEVVELLPGGVPQRDSLELLSITPTPARHEPRPPAP